MTWGFVAAAAATVVGSKMQGDAANKAARTSAASADKATQLQWDMYDQTRQDQAPWREAGVNALGQLTDRTGANGDLMRSFGMSDFTADPGYQFRMSQGLGALEGRAAAGGGLRSGNTLKALMEYGQNLGSQEYGNAYNRFNTDQNTQYNRLASMAGLGQTANAALQSAGGNYANNAGNLMMQSASDQGNAALAAGNARASAFQGIGNVAGNALYSYFNQPQGNFSTGMPREDYYSGGAGTGYGSF